MNGTFNKQYSIFWTCRIIFCWINDNRFSSCSSSRRCKMRVFSIKISVSKSIYWGICDIFFIHTIHNLSSIFSFFSTFYSVFFARISTFTSTSSSSKSTISSTYIKTSFLNHFIISNNHLSTVCTFSSRATTSISCCAICSVSISSFSSSSTFSSYTIIENTSCIQMKSIHVCNCISTNSSTRFYIIGISSFSTFNDSTSSNSGFSICSSLSTSFSSIVSISTISTISSPTIFTNCSSFSSFSSSSI